MTKLLIRLFAKGDPAQPAVRARTGKLSGVVGIVCNLLLASLKLLVGIVSGAVSVAADGMNNLSDATSSVVTLIGFRLAEKPADEDHPYGHARYEYLSGLAVAGIMLVIGVELVITSVEKLLSPQTVELTWLAAAVLTGSVLVKLWLWVFNRGLGKRISSQALMATAADSRNDVIATAAVLAALLVEHFTRLKVDGWLGIGVAVFILYSGITVARQTISPLLGENASPELTQAIVAAIAKQEKILGYHDLMVHDYGPGQRFASVHVEMDEKESALACHEIIDRLERLCLQEHNIHLVIHYDPVVTDDPELDRLRERVQNILAQTDRSITIHDFRMTHTQSGIRLSFDVVLPFRLMHQKKQLQQQLEQQLNEGQGPACQTVITFDVAGPGGG